MAFCKHCGKELEEGAKFCPSCGKSTTEGANINDTISHFTETSDNTAEFAQEDIAKNKAMAVLSYLGLLVLVPIFCAKDSKYAKFHANQGLALFICEVVWNGGSNIIRKIIEKAAFWSPFHFVYWGTSGIFGVVSLALFVLAIVGIVYAATGKAQELPVIGKIKIIK